MLTEPGSATAWASWPGSCCSAAAWWGGRSCTRPSLAPGARAPPLPRARPKVANAICLEYKDARHWIVTHITIP
jgi:hypothetical protein